MKTVRDIGNALLVAFVSIGLIFGALSISLVGLAPDTATPTTTPSVEPTLPSPPASIATSTPPATAALASPTDTLTPTVLPTNTETLTPQPTISTPSGTPSATAATAVKTTCVKGAIGWTFTYIVKAGDTLYNIGYQHYTTLDLMRRVNCRVIDTIFIGERLWVPLTATRTPFPSVTPYPTDPLTVTVLPFTVTYSPIPTSTPVPTETAVPTASFTPPSPSP